MPFGNRLSNAGATERFAAEREIIFTLIGKPHQVEAITANFESYPKGTTPLGPCRSRHAVAV